MSGLLRFLCLWCAGLCSANVLAQAIQNEQLEQLLRQRPDLVDQLQATKGVPMPVPATAKPPTEVRAPAGAPQPPRLPAEAPLRGAPPKPFGYELFAGTPNSFAPVTDIPVTADYVIGPGDTVIINFLGNRNTSEVQVVNREGQIRVGNLGPIMVAGMTFEAMSLHLLKRIEEQMIGTKAAITMGPLRSIRVFILGEANLPGSYTVSALSTLSNALIVSGGVKDIGSLRNIELRRGERVVRQLDLYDLLLKGDARNDERLQPGDAIFIPKVGARASVTGDVLRPAIYELKGERTAQQLLELAGGLLPTAFPQASQLERVDANRYKTIVEVDLATPAGRQTAIRSGDTLRVYAVLDTLEKVVQLSGHVARPRHLQWREGARLTDLVGHLDDLLPRADLDYALVRREDPADRRISLLPVRLREVFRDPAGPANLALRPRDEVIVFPADAARTQILAPLFEQIRSQARYRDPEKIVAIHGHVKLPGRYPLEDGMTVRRLVEAAVDVRERTDLEHAVLARLQPSTRQLAVQHISLRDALLKADMPLQAGDELYVLPLDRQLKEVNAVQANLLGGKGSENKLALAESTTQARQTFLGEGVKDNKAQDNKTQDNKAQDNKAQDNKAQDNKAQDNKAQDNKAQDNKAQDNKAQDNKAQDTVDRVEILKPLLERLRQQSRADNPTRIVEVRGAVVSSGAYPLTQRMKISDLIGLAGHFSEEAYLLEGELARHSLNDGKLRQVEHRKIDLGAIARGDPSQDIELQPYDNLIIRPIPGWAEQAVVEVGGRLRFPGKYVIRRGEKLSTLIQRAGGFLDNAAPEAAIFTRENLRLREQEALDTLSKRIETDISTAALRSANAPANAAGTTGNATALVAMLDGLQKRIKNAQALGRLAIDLPQILDEVSRQGESRYDITLEAGDRLFIPEPQESVTVMGEVNHPTSVRHDESLGLGKYLESAGGATQNADESRIYVIRANGRVVTGNRFVSWLVGTNPDVKPGDTVVVPLDVQQIAPITLWTSLSQVFSSLAISLAAMKTIGGN